jgi:GWxTD domain-containing protein
MTILEHFTSSSFAGTIGWALLHSLWEGAIIASLLAAVLIATRSPRARYIVACAAMFAMFGSFGVTLVRLMPDRTNNAQAFQLPHPLWTALPEGESANRWNFNLSAIAPWLGPFWFAGVSLICLWHGAGWLFAQRLRHRGVCAVSNVWQKELSSLAERLRISRPVLLVESCFTEVPVVLGHFRPLILLPIGLLTGLPAEQLEALLLHELAHIRRDDYFVNILQRLAEAFFFYHPTTWWISRVIRTEREHCCDDIVVSLIGDAHEYSVALAALEEKRLLIREVAVAATGGNLMKRIHRMLQPKATRGVWAPLLAVAVLLVTCAATAAAWRSQAQKQQPSDAAQAHPNQTPKARSYDYEKWLNDDVVYIADDAERAAFIRLTTNEERDHFIEQFWERRNPAPGTTRNKFKDEHYRRITFANQRFGTASGAPGWNTDRGHIYIVYGSPDQVDAHAKTADKPFATEVWVYHHLEGIGNDGSVTFIDRTGRGEFKLAPGNAPGATP